MTAGSLEVTDGDLPDGEITPKPDPWGTAEISGPKQYSKATWKNRLHTLLLSPVTRASSLSTRKNTDENRFNSGQGSMTSKVEEGED